MTFVSVSTFISTLEVQFESVYRLDPLTVQGGSLFACGCELVSQSGCATFVDTVAAAAEEECRL